MMGKGDMLTCVVVQSCYEGTQEICESFLLSTVKSLLCSKQLVNFENPLFSCCEDYKSATRTGSAKSLGSTVS